MKNEIFWKNPGYKTRPELRKDIECDYLVVGGGVTGVSAAYFLAKSGAKNIVLVEKNYVGSGASGKSAGTLVTRGETNLQDLIKQYGRPEALILWRRTHNAMQVMKKIIDEENIACDLEQEDTLMCGFKGENWNNLYREYKEEKSIEGTTVLLKGANLKRELNTTIFNHGVLSKAHALNLNPLKFVQGFSQVIERYGVTIFENTEVKKTAHSINNIAETRYGNIKYKKIVWAIDVDYPEKNIKNLKTTVVVTRPLTHSELIKIGFGESKKVVWDSRKNEYYFKITKDRRLLVGFGGILVGKNHKKTAPHLPHLQQIKNFIKILFPYLHLEIKYAWSGHFAVNRHYSKGPFVVYEKDRAVISGAGSQVVGFMTARHVAKKLLGKPNPNR